MALANIDGPHNLSRESRLAGNKIDDIDWRNAHGFADIHPQARLLDGGAPALLLFPVGRLRARLWGRRTIFVCPRGARWAFLSHFDSLRAIVASRLFTNFESFRFLLSRGLDVAFRLRFS